jgi:pimeloyl-ACP methyl ester carboxylesterase
VLAVSSGGIDFARYGGVDWRSEFRAQHPHLPDWFLKERRDLSAQLRTIDVPVLLLSGDADPISPVAAAERLAELFMRAQLVVFPGGTHDLIEERAGEVIPHIARHLGIGI